MNIGILLPKSGEHPAIALDLVQAMKAALAAQGCIEEVNLLTENIGFGENEKELYEKTEKLILVHNADLIVAYIDNKVIPVLEPLLFVSNKIMIVVNAGANYPFTKVPQPNIIYITLQQAYAATKAVNLAAHKQAAYATSFYDCGYSIGTGMLENYFSNNNQVLFNYINNQKKAEPFHINELIHFLEQQPAKTIQLLCNFDEQMAALFYYKLNEYTHAQDLSLVVSPMMLTPTALNSNSPGYDFKIEGYATWLPSLNTDTNKDFAASFLKLNKKEPSLFSFSGWQVGLLLSHLFAAFKNNELVPEDVPELLSNIELETAAGKYIFDARTNHFIAATMWKVTLEAASTTPGFEAVEPGISDWHAFVDAQPTGVSSGWMNTYLCY